VDNGPATFREVVVVRHPRLWSYVSVAVRLVGDTHHGGAWPKPSCGPGRGSIPFPRSQGRWLAASAHLPCGRNAQHVVSRFARSKAVEMNAQQDHLEGESTRLHPSLDEAINQFGAKANAATVRQEGTRLRSAKRVRPAAAQKRQRGRSKIGTNQGNCSHALGTALQLEVVTAAPAGLASRASPVPHSGRGRNRKRKTLLRLMTVTKPRRALITAPVLASVVTSS